MKKIAFLLLLAILTQAVTAQDSEEGYTSSNELVLQISTLPEIKLGYTHRLIFPFLQGEGPLTRGNNINLSFTGEVSPVSLNALAEAVWTPIAFITLTAGVRLGTGWRLDAMNANGIGLNIPGPGPSGEPVYDGSPFDALMWRLKFGGTFQFDLAAVLPGDWNHVVFQTYHEINYQANTRAGKNQSWYVESDDGENMNGFNFYGNYLLGYQMPLILNTVGFLAEMDLYLYDTPNRKVWGDDLIRWKFSGLFLFQFTKNWSLAILAQFKTKRNFIEPNWKDLHYTNRHLNTSDPLLVEFYRAAAVVTYKF